MFKLLVVAVVFVYIASAAPPPNNFEQPRKDFKKGWEPRPEPEPEPTPWDHHHHPLHSELPKKGGPPGGRLPPPHFGTSPKQGPGKGGPGEAKGHVDGTGKGGSGEQAQGGQRGPGGLAPSDPKNGIGGPGKTNAEDGQVRPEGNLGGGVSNPGVAGGSGNSPVDNVPVENGQPSPDVESGSAPVESGGVVGENSGSPSESETTGAGSLDVRAKP